MKTKKRSGRPLTQNALNGEAKLPNADVLRHQIAFMWRIHYLSSLVVQPVYPNITLKFGLSLIEWRILVTLAHAPGSAAGEILDLWALEKMAVSRAVRRLLKIRLVTRLRDPLDTRRHPLSLTSKGKAIFRAAWPTAKDSYDRLTSILSPTDLRTFLRISDQLIEEARIMVSDLMIGRKGRRNRSGRGLG